MASPVGLEPGDTPRSSSFSARWQVVESNVGARFERLTIRLSAPRYNIAGDPSFLRSGAARAGAAALFCSRRAGVSHWLVRFHPRTQFRSEERRVREELVAR